MGQPKLTDIAWQRCKVVDETVAMCVANLQLLWTHYVGWGKPSQGTSCTKERRCDCMHWRI